MNRARKARLLGSRAVLSLFVLLPMAAAPWAARAESAPAAPKRPYPITEKRQPCSDFTPTRRPFFGDTHVHTTHSQDASTQDTRITPIQAYRFAMGEPLGIQPYDEAGKSRRTVQLDRPLDFAVVTDHAEQLGEVHICKTPGLPGHGSLVCRMYRSFPRVAFFVMNGRYSVFGSRWGFCGDQGEHCLDAAGTVWRSTRAAAEQAYDRSDRCRFTSFVGYEWTGAPRAAHLHRNVIFRNEKVPDLPTSVMETGPVAIELWRRLDLECEAGKPGCQAITIPHNSNLSAGHIFSSAIEPLEPLRKEEVAARRKYDRLVEVMQHKGDSECALVPGVTDEACAFETIANPSAHPLVGGGEVRAVDMVRDALKRGLELERRFGANPMAFGLIASTDTHLGTPGLTRERGHPGHGGAGLGAADEMPPGLPDNLEYNPGGLAVLWAEENSRDALFEAMLRREAYGTSGNRPILRLFGGYEYPESLCDDPRLTARGYAGGVPMGGRLGAAPEGRAPRFVVAGQRDPAPHAGRLQRLQIVKGWLADGQLHEKVFDVAGGENGATVDLDTCAVSGPGEQALCSVWEDPDFDPGRRAFYYARLLENPSCRWSQWACVEGGVDCSDPSTIGEGFEPCCEPEHVRTIQERAWSSPIWYTPAE